MKTDDQLLLTYMYLEGHTEEDMYDERMISIVWWSIDFQIYLYKQKFRTMHDSLIETFQNMFDGIKETFQPIAKWMEGLHKDYRIINKRKSYLKINNSKNKLRLFHQVENRKPRHLVRKIIR